MRVNFKFYPALFDICPLKFITLLYFYKIDGTVCLRVKAEFTIFLVSVVFFFPIIVTFLGSTCTLKWFGFFFPQRYLICHLLNVPSSTFFGHSVIACLGKGSSKAFRKFRRSSFSLFYHVFPSSIELCQENQVSTLCLSKFYIFFVHF